MEVLKMDCPVAILIKVLAAHRNGVAGNIPKDIHRFHVTSSEGSSLEVPSQSEALFTHVRHRTTIVPICAITKSHSHSPCSMLFQYSHW